jgi:dienelactone hydrolase
MSRLGSPTDNLSREWSGSATDIGSQLTAENRSIEVGGDSVVHRWFGNTQTNAPPLLCLQHFRGNLDFWDTMMHTKNSQLLAERLPNAHLRIYPDANHGFLDQYPELFADQRWGASTLDATTKRQEREDK